MEQSNSLIRLISENSIAYIGNCAYFSKEQSEAIKYAVDNMPNMTEYLKQYGEDNKLQCQPTIINVPTTIAITKPQ